MENRRKEDQRLKQIKDILEEDIKPQLKKLVDTIHGNGNLGLKTEVALNTQSTKRQWYFIGGISLTLMSGTIGLGYYIIKVL